MLIRCIQGKLWLPVAVQRQITVHGDCDGGIVLGGGAQTLLNARHHLGGHGALAAARHPGYAHHNPIKQGRSRRIIMLQIVKYGSVVPQHQT